MEKPIIFLLLQLTFLIWMVKFYKNRNRLSASSMASYGSIFFYLSIVVTVIITNIILQNKLDSFDLNHDGIFSGKEITTEQKLALNNLTADTGRTLAPFIGIIYSFVYFLMIYFVLKMVRKKPNGIEPNG
ncbi:hypothetical protein G4D82_10600 [Flavobacterium sp. CYK-4]|uniref:hypothetical protein n=1 Tax=Flavobacterium lotistagni TaxID=2709660 RepID=UPI0014089172|nr:hypothetical protein [Flavobacterium lotistagni]NHM07672.1 hypothetical protein [Flavobacterium lotistagni]